MAWKSPNAIIGYFDGTDLLARGLWVTKIEQPINLAVSKQQSRHASMVYPRSYAPGNMSVTGRCESQTKYHELSLFIRKHQIAIIDSPVTDRFARLTSGNLSGFHRLLQLSIPKEGVLLRGWIDAFSVTNRGFQDPAPEYTFQFFVVSDQMDEDIGISHTIKGVYNEDDNVFASRGKKKQPGAPAPEPGNRDYPSPKPITDPDIPEGSPIHPR